MSPIHSVLNFKTPKHINLSSLFGQNLYLLFVRLAMITPESFIDVIRELDPDEKNYLNNQLIFTLRQLACADESRLEFMDTERIKELKSLAADAIRMAAERDSKPKPESNDIVWGYCYVNKVIYDMIENQGAYKSPYVLFQEYVNCPAEERSQHPWRSIYYSVVDECQDRRLQVMSDSDAFSHLTWSVATTVGNMDFTKGSRAIPFLWNWMPGELHGTSMGVNRIFAEERKNPGIADRYDFQIAINLTEVSKQGGDLYYVEPQYNNFNKNKWEGCTIRQAGTKHSVWFDFLAGNDYRSTVPHGIVVTPDGTIPKSCIRLFKPVPVQVRDVVF